MRLPTLPLFAALPLAVLAEKTPDASDSNANGTQAVVSDGIELDDAAKLLQSVQGVSTDGCEAACASLLNDYGSKVATREEKTYKDTIEYFWSAQQQVPKPHCIFRPETAQEVANMVLVSKKNQCQFALRSGGHAAFKGASSADGGITVILENMASIVLSKDKKIASIGPGAVWADIYSNLGEHNLAVVGGRVADIGIGGLVTGGGISHFSNERGWACDNVASYEVVLADGRIVTAEPDTEFSDLYWALRGGGNNIGIVTRFNLETFAHGPLMYGGHRIYMNDSFAGAMDAFVDLGQHADRDPKAAQILSLVVNPENQMTIMFAELEYADPKTDAPIFETWNKVPAVHEATRLNTLTNLTLDLMQSSPRGFRQSYWTATAKLNRELIDRTFDDTLAAFEKIKHIPGIVPANSLQVITEPQLKHMSNKGGNALGLSPTDGPLLLINIAFRWNNAEDDELALTTCADLINKFKKTSKDMGLDTDFLYMNYASQFQDVVGSYGKSADKLRGIANKYDPEGVFQKLQPGYFKLNGPPVKEFPWP